MAVPPRSKGDLTPRPDVRMSRLPPPADLTDVMRHWWIPAWDLPAGEARVQHVLGYPVCNLVVEETEARLHGPTTRGTTRELRGRGWAVGALLAPAAGRHLTDVPIRDLVDATVPVTLRSDTDLTTSEGALAALTARLRIVTAALDDDDHAANRMLSLVEDDPTITRVPELAARLHRSERTVQRLALRTIGLPPAVVIRRRRLQDAADAVRRDPDAALGDVAVRFGFADHAHLTREFRAVLGFTPSHYRDGTL